VRNFLFLIVTACALAACSGSAPKVETAGALPQLIVDSGANYRLGIGDKVKVTVLGQPDLSGESEVDAGGKIVVALAGAVDAAGLSVTDVAGRIQAAFAQQQMLRDPKIAVQVVEYRPITVTGEVKTPGRHKFTFGLDVRSAVAMAGGFDKRANQKTMIVYRNNQAYDARGESVLEPGDTLEVPRR
jgi:protein involved in polysaccharide export with SLBB domain